MKKPQILFVGRPDRVAHHAAALQPHLNLVIAEPEQVLADARPGDLAIFYSEHFDRFRDTCRQLRQRRIPTLYMIDGILEWRNAWENEPDEIACPHTMRPVLSDKVACIGPSQARVLRSWGNAGKIEIVGIPRLEPLRRSFSDRVTAGRAGSPDQPFRLLVMTAKTPAFTSDQWRLVRQSLEDLRQWTQQTPQIRGRPLEVTWRLTRNLDRELGVENQLSDLTGVDLGRILDRVDAVVTTPSTAMLEAMLRDLPVALLNYHHHPHYVQAGWNIAAAEQLDVTLNELAHPAERRLVFQRQQLADALQLTGNAVDRTVALVESMLRLAADQQQASSPPATLNFPASLLPPVPTEYPAFDHRSVFPETPEFDRRDTLELQVELSHARREIRHLRAELAVRESELQQAHEIFESIHDHPIAGPVVRIRQKIRDMLAAMGQRNKSRANDESNYITGTSATSSPPPNENSDSDDDNGSSVPLNSAQDAV